MVQLKGDELSLARRFLSCRLHDLMRDLCLEKCREEEFIDIVHLHDDASFRTDNSAHRFVVHVSNDDNGAARISSPQVDWKQSRSLFLLSESRGYTEKEMVWPEGIVMQSFKVLKVLKFEGFDFAGKKLPLDWRNLIHLRILSFKYCKLDELPSCIADLPLLHTLDLEVKYEIKIPNVLWKIKKLRHLYFSFKHCTDGGRLRLHGLRELETVWALQGKADEIADLSELVNLRVLYVIIKDDANLYALMDYISKNGQNVRMINLSIGENCDFISSEGHDLLLNVLACESVHSLYFDAKLVEFPCFKQHFLRGLATLRLDGNHIEEDPMEALGQLPQLRSLSLGRKSYVGRDLICLEQGFPQLRYLSFYEFSNLEYWRVDEGCMPNLTNLEIWHCESLEMVPFGLLFIEGLKELKIGGMPNEFCERVTMADADGRGGHNYYKIQHVPSISVFFPVHFASLKLS